MADQTEPTVLVEERGNLGVITLNQPRAINALSYQMMRLIDDALDAFQEKDSIKAVLLRGAGERGFCAGGDVVALYRAIDGRQEDGVEFFRFEYTLDLRTSTYPKPIISLMDGLVLGGGVGISAHTSHRVVTERTRTGMPETVIGFSPDVGGLNILARAPHQLGTLMALTGLHVTGADALAVGMADYFVPSDRLDALTTALEGVESADAVAGVIEGFTEEAPESHLLANAGWIEGAFAGESAEQILDAVAAAAQEHEFAATVLAALTKNSPTGIKTALEAVRRAEGQTLAQTLNQDFITSYRAMGGHDMREGIRAQLIDKDRNPQWAPASLEEVTREQVLAFFEPGEPGELGLSG